MSFLNISNVGARFGGVVALQGVDLKVPQGVIFGLIGPNGAGKTTLINLISGLIPPTSGTIELQNGLSSPYPIERAVRHGVVRTFQQTRAFLGLTVRENLRIAQVAARNRPDIAALARTCGLSDVLDRQALDLPYVTLRHLGIALALALDPKLLLLDEPAVGLTQPEVDRLEGIVRACKERGITVLLVEHNVRFLMAVSERVAVLNRGQLLFEGTPSECQSNSKVIDVYLGKGETQHA